MRKSLWVLLWNLYERLLWLRLTITSSDGRSRVGWANGSIFCPRGTKFQRGKAHWRLVAYCAKWNNSKEQKPRTPALSPCPPVVPAGSAPLFGVFIPAPYARAAVRGR